jgi:hypothetical protein
MARRTLILVAAGLLAAAGCLGTSPPPPSQATQVCGLGFGSAGEYLLDFYQLGHANTGWVTADGFVPITLPPPDGRTVWWMSDTMTGSANPDNSVTSPGNVHNSAVVQGGGCLTPTFGSPEMMPGTAGTWYWPGSAVVQGNTMAVFAYKVVPASGQPGFNWRVVGTAVARFGLPSLQLLGPPVDMPNTKAPNGGDAIPWGIRSFLATDGTVYLYGTTKYSAGAFGVAADAWLARAPFDQPTQLEYFTNPIAPVNPADSWSTDFANAKPMTFTKIVSGDDSSPAAQLSVVPYGNRYLAGAFAADVFQDNQGRSFVRAWEADSPQGPWKMVMNGANPQTIATFQRRSSKQIAYDARITQLPGGAGWTVVYSANDPVNQQQDFTLYRGQFAPPNGLPAP